MDYFVFGLLVLFLALAARASVRLLEDSDSDLTLVSFTKKDTLRNVRREDKSKIRGEREEKKGTTWPVESQEENNVTPEYKTADVVTRVFADEKKAIESNAIGLDKKKQPMAGSDGKCVVCGWKCSEGHGWPCITYFMSQSVSWYKAKLRMARDLLVKIDLNTHVTSEEVKRAINQIQFCFDLLDGYKPE